MNNLESLLEFIFEGIAQTKNWRKYASDLNKEIKDLETKVHDAYKHNYENAEDLDVDLTKKQHELENILSVINNDDNVEDKNGSYGHEEFMRQIANLYKHYIEKIPFQGVVNMNKKDLVAMIRGYAESFGWYLGGFKSNTTDEELYDAAKDSYYRIRHLQKIYSKNKK